jgi:hypothetical protein
VSAPSRNAARAEHATSHDTRGGGLIWFVWAASALVLYVLSTGPVAKLYAKGFLPQAPLMFLYQPLGLLGDNVPPVRTFFEWYIIDVWHCYPSSAHTR